MKGLGARSHSGVSAITTARNSMAGAGTPARGHGTHGTARGLKKNVLNAGGIQGRFILLILSSYSLSRQALWVVTY